MEKFPLIDTLRRSLEGRTVVVVDHAIVWQPRFREVAGNPHNIPCQTKARSKKLDSAKKGEAPADAEIVAAVKPEDDEVGGRYRRFNNVICPYCYTLV